MTRFEIGEAYAVHSNGKYHKRPAIFRGMDTEDIGLFQIGKQVYEYHVLERKDGTWCAWCYMNGIEASDKWETMAKTNENADMKSDLQAAVKALRDTLGGSFPKAMMTAAQASKCTATVNCGHGDNGKKIADAVQAFPEFRAWCERYGIKTVTVEQIKYYANFQYQVRVQY